MHASIRVNSLTLSGKGHKTLPGMQAHGMRLDGSSKRRKVRNVEPLVYGSLDLQTAYSDHVKGCRMNAGLKRPAMHAIIQFPPQIRISEANERKMLQLAVQFINKTHGGDAVFAARLDRDEDGRHTVDVFYSPKYVKETKKGSEMWISTTKHGKELCERHRGEIERRHGGTFSTSPRQVGIALQAELYDFLRSKNLRLADRKEKDNSRPDRLEPEEYKTQAEIRNLRGQVKALLDENKVLKTGQKVLRNMVEKFRPKTQPKTDETERDNSRFRR